MSLTEFDVENLSSQLYRFYYLVYCSDFRWRWV